MGMVAVVILLLSTLCVNTTLMALIGERPRICFAKSTGRFQKIDRTNRDRNLTGDQCRRHGWAGIRVDISSTV